jgi:hypothetical protein
LLKQQAHCEVGFTPDAIHIVNEDTIDIWREVCHDPFCKDIRPTYFIWFDQVGFNVGILYAYVVGTAGNYMLLNLTCLAIPVLFVLLFIWMPEAPQYLLSRDKSAGAEKSLQWLRGKGYNVDHELQQLKVSDQHLTT